MANLAKITQDEVYDGVCRSFEDFRFDLENALTLTQLTGRSVEEKGAATLMIALIGGTEGKTVHEVEAMVNNDARDKEASRVLFTVLAANTAGRARAIVRDDAGKRNGAWAWAKLRERFSNTQGAGSYNDVFQYSWPKDKAFEDVWRDWVKKVTRLPRGALNDQALEQLTINGLQRTGQTELESHLRLRAPQSWMDIQQQVDRFMNTMHATQAATPMDIGIVMAAPCSVCGKGGHLKADCKLKDAICRNCGKVGHIAAVCRSGAKGYNVGKGYGKSKGAGKDERHKGHGKGNSKDKKCICCGRLGHRKAECKFKDATCSLCHKVGHLRAVCRSGRQANAVEDSSGDANVDEVWCMTVGSSKVIESERGTHYVNYDENGEISYKQRVEEARALTIHAASLKRELQIAKQQVTNIVDLKKEIFQLQKELLKEWTKVKALSEEMQDNEISKLTARIREADAERQHQKKAYEALIVQRNNPGTQLIRRNDELALLYEKRKIRRGSPQQQRHGNMGARQARMVPHQRDKPQADNGGFEQRRGGYGRGAERSLRGTRLQ